MPCFLRALSVWASPQTPTKETFREKFLGISKAFAKIKWCVRWEVLWHTFLRKKGVENSDFLPIKGLT